MLNLKKTILSLILTGFVSVVAHATTATQSPPADTGFTDPAKAIMVSAKASQFSIVLHANPTTGYMWFLEKYDPNFITVVNHLYQPPTDTRLVGAGGKDIWVFKLNPAAFSAPHMLKINMVYARPWAIDQGRKETVFNVVSH
jgi:predicted secreted protein